MGSGRGNNSGCPKDCQIVFLPMFALWSCQESCILIPLLLLVLLIPFKALFMRIRDHNPRDPELI